MRRECRVIVDPPGAGDWNMAVDEALLHSAAAGITTLRFYQWNEPTLSLGYFQSYLDREQHPPSCPCACVRRTTGGGAILHDRELTYSFTTPLTERMSPAAGALYEAFHATLIEVLRKWRIDARIAGKTIADAGAPPFLCFQRHTPEDVLWGEAKLCGSAQRRHRGALLQHGSVILQTSDQAPEIAGIRQLSGIPIEPGELAAAWQNALAMRLNLALESRPLPSEELRAAREIHDARFASLQWTQRR